MTNAAAATHDDIETAISLLSNVLKFSAYALEHMPPPPSTNGAALWKQYEKNGGSSFSVFNDYAWSYDSRRIEEQSGGTVPTANQLSRKIVAMVDLGVLNRDVDKVVFPDPLLLTAKSSVNWTRKFAFQMIASPSPWMNLSLRWASMIPFWATPFMLAAMMMVPDPTRLKQSPPSPTQALEVVDEALRDCCAA